MKIGYASVTTKKLCASLDEQIKLLKNSRCKEVYSEVVKGTTAKRAELTTLLAKLKTGDTLVITSINNLGSSLQDLISIISALKERSIKFQSLREQMNTGTESGTLMFNMMGFIAEFERKLINRRIYDGVKRAKELGKYKGRSHSVDKDIRQEYVRMIKSGKYTMAYIAKMAKVSRQTLYHWHAELDAEIA